MVQVVGGCAAAAMVGWLLTAPSLGMTSEDRMWEGFFTELGPSQLWCRSHGSYRPLCGSLLWLQSQWAYWMKLSFSFLAHLAGVGLSAWLGWRIRGRPAAWVAAAVPFLWATQGEVTLWLGGRCELMWVLPALLGAHAMLSALREDRLRWSAAAAACAVASALGKENGFLLPLIWLPLGYGRAPRLIARHLAVPAVALLATFAARTWLLRGVGTYTAQYLDDGVIAWAGNLAYGVTKLAIGAPIRWPTWLAVVVPLLSLGLALVLIRRFGWRPVLWTCVGLAAILLPTALVHAPRTLYGATHYLGIALGVAVAVAGRSMAVAVALALVVHTGATLVSQRLWVRVSQERARTMAAARQMLPEVDRVFLLGLRWRWFGIPASPINPMDFHGERVTGILAARYGENGAHPFRTATLRSAGRCEARFALELPPGAPFVPGDAEVDLGDDQHTIRVPSPTAILYHDGSALQRLVLPCPAGARDRAEGDREAAP